MTTNTKFKSYNLFISLSINVILIFILVFLSFKPKAQSQDKIDSKASDEKMSYLGSDTVKLTFLGDYLFYYVDWQKAFEGFPIQVTNCSTSDFSSKQLSWTIQNWVFNTNPNICVFQTGSVDYFLNIPLKQTLENIRMIVDSIQGRNIDMMVVAALIYDNSEKANNYQNELNDSIKNICTDKQISFIELTGDFYNNSACNHLNDDLFTLNEPAVIHLTNQIIKALPY